LIAIIAPSRSSTPGCGVLPGRVHREADHERLLLRRLRPCVVDLPRTEERGAAHTGGDAAEQGARDRSRAVSGRLDVDCCHLASRILLTWMRLDRRIGCKAPEIARNVHSESWLVKVHRSMKRRRSCLAIVERLFYCRVRMQPRPSPPAVGAHREAPHGTFAGRLP
jgi:hypothetical protein